jgi:hypothetical protein
LGLPSLGSALAGLGAEGADGVLAVVAGDRDQLIEDLGPFAP